VIVGVCVTVGVSVTVGVWVAVSVSVRVAEGDGVVGAIVGVAVWVEEGVPVAWAGPAISPAANVLPPAQKRPVIKKDNTTHTSHTRPNLPRRLCPLLNLSSILFSSFPCPAQYSGINRTP
jgi:hypothetical protein